MTVRILQDYNAPGIYIPSGAIGHHSIDGWKFENHAGAYPVYISRETIYAHPDWFERVNLEDIIEEGSWLWKIREVLNGRL